MSIFLKIISCPYCFGGFKLVKQYGEGKNILIIKCLCDEYPVIDNLAFLIKDDSQLSKKIIRAIKENNLKKIIWACLSGMYLPHRLIIFAAYFLNKRFGVKIEEKKLLSTLKFSGGNWLWFDYLINREEAADFNLALKTLNYIKNGELIVDLGCGTGLLIKEANEKGLNDKFFLGVDKSILTLMIAQLSNKINNVFFVLSDLEQGIPLKNWKASRVISLNSLPWIYSKKRICLESARVLKKNGKMYIFNSFSNTDKTKFWGDGLSSVNLKSYLNRQFSELRIFNSPGVKKRKINELNYNVLAVRK